MRILQINSVYGVGSTGKIVSDISDTLIKNGHDSFVAYGYGNEGNEKKYKINSTLELKLSIIRTRFFGKHAFYNKHQTRKLIIWMNYVKPDIVHLHNIHGHYINIELVLNYLANKKIPVVWTLHDCWTFTGHCAYFDYIGCEKWKTGCKKCPQKKTYPKSLIFDRSEVSWKEKKELICSLDNLTLITPSLWLADLTRQSYLGNKPIITINNGIDLKRFYHLSSDIRQELGIQNKKVVLCVASEWDNRKGIQFIQEIANKLGDEFQVIIVGVKAKQKKKFQSNVITISKTNSIEEIAKIYSIADVFINPTLEDNFPTTNLEALACGTPIITFSTGGSVEAVEKKCGKISPKGDIDALVSMIKMTETDNNIRKQCRKLAENKYNKDDRFNDYLELYKKVISGIEIC